MFLLGVFSFILGRVEALRNRSELGAAAVEYGLLVALVALFIVGAVTLLGQKVQGVFCAVVTGLDFGPMTCP